MTDYARRRIRAAERIDHDRNGPALAASRERCLEAASERLAWEITDLPGGQRARAADPSLCHAARPDEGVDPLQATPSSTT